MSYWAHDGWQTSSSRMEQFERLGHPGRFTNVKQYKGGLLALTGSNFGYGSVLFKLIGVGTSGSLSDGGDRLPLDVFSTGVIHELSLAELSGSAGQSDIYLFKRQQ
jgi:hypothetical protein